MTLKQLRYLLEIVRHDLHLSNAAAALHTSQPGVSRQIQLLERELGVLILERKRNRILGLTAPGKEIVRFAERMLREEQNIRTFRAHLKEESAGSFTIATNRTHACYTLPPVVAQFARTHPRVRIQFVQAHREESFRKLDMGEVHLAIGTDCDASLPNVVLLPCDRFHRVIVTPQDHPLLGVRKPTLRQIAAHPLITHGLRTRGPWKFSATFRAKKLEPNVVLNTVDADISKAYVRLGLGIAIVPHIAFDRERDRGLSAIDVSHLFEPETVYLGLNRNLFYRRFVFEFIEALAPGLTRRRVEQALAA